MKFHVPAWAALGLMLATLGCGNNTPVSPIVMPSGTPIPSSGPFQPGLGFTGSCPTGLTGDFVTNCALCFHGRLLNFGGQPVCHFREEVVARPYLSNGLPIPVLSPNDPSGPEAWPVYPAFSGQLGSYPITLQRGFHLEFSGSGRWDFATSGAFNVGFCRNNDFTGARRSVRGSPFRPGPIVNPENGMPEELFGSDGIEAFPLGEGMGDRIVANNGVLRIGFNVPSVGISRGCFETDDLRFTISGCVNSAWVVVPCR